MNLELIRKRLPAGGPHLILTSEHRAASRPRVQVHPAPCVPSDGERPFELAGVDARATAAELRIGELPLIAFVAAHPLLEKLEYLDSYILVTLKAVVLSSRVFGRWISDLYSSRAVILRHDGGLWFCARALALFFGQRLTTRFAPIVFARFPLFKSWRRKGSLWPQKMII